jgi:hypothetical protein
MKGSAVVERPHDAIACCCPRRQAGNYARDGARVSLGRNGDRAGYVGGKTAGCASLSCQHLADDIGHGLARIKCAGVAGTGRGQPRFCPE